MHIDYSDMMAADGIKVTWVFAGAEKVDGNSYERLSNRARASIQRDVDYHYGLFVDAVARNRDLSDDEVRATEARCYLPPEAVDLGLIDAVETPAAAVANFFNEITSDADGGDNTMTTKTEGNNGTAVGAAITAPVVAQPAPAMTQADIQAAIAQGVSIALSAERTRAAGIRTCEEAKGREPLAAHLADNTSMSVDEAKAILAVAPKAEEKPATGSTTESTRPPTAFAAAMDRTANPGVGADQPTGSAAPGEEKTPEATASRLLANYAGMTGRKVIPINRAA
jgi:ClpP class serine protease